MSLSAWSFGVKCAMVSPMKKLALRLIFLIFPFAAPVAADVTSPSGRTVECFCTDSQGARVEIGEMRCLNVTGRLFMARCEMSLNVPMWREQKGGCASS